MCRDSPQPSRRWHPSWSARSQRCERAPLRLPRCALSGVAGSVPARRLDQLPVLFHPRDVPRNVFCPLHPLSPPGLKCDGEALQATQSDIATPLHLFARDREFEVGQASQRGAQADMDALPESDMAIEATGNIQVIGIGKLPLIAVG